MVLFIVITSLLTNSLAMRGEKNNFVDNLASVVMHMSLSIFTTGIYHSLQFIHKYI